jgi:hypothetical protein
MTNQMQAYAEQTSKMSDRELVAEYLTLKNHPDADLIAEEIDILIAEMEARMIDPTAF